MITSSSTSDRQKYVAELKRGSVGLSFAESRLVCDLATLVMESYLVRSSRSAPIQFWRVFSPNIIEPRRFVGLMTIRRLPYFAAPSLFASMPPDALRLFEPIDRPRSGFGRMFQYTAPSADRGQSRSKTPAIISRPVVIASPSSIIHRRHRPPFLARRMRHDRPRTSIETGVTVFVPGIDVGQAEIAASRRYKEGGNHARPRRNLRR